MYFVVYLLNDRINIVVPQTWICDYQPQMEKFINRGLNSNQTFLCFWSQDPLAFESNGQPKPEFVPNVFTHAVKFPEGGWHLCKIKRFHGMFFLYVVVFKF